MFLTVLCILTFLGSGKDLVNNIVGWSKADKTATANKAEIEKRLVKGDSKESAENGKIVAQELDQASEQKLKAQSISQIIACLLCIVGAALMFKLKIYGFWVYLAGSVIGLAVPLYLYAWATVPWLIALVKSGLVGLAFVLMYAYCMYELRRSAEKDFYLD